MIQGYPGAAAVDAKHQIIVDTQAHGPGSEQELLVPVVRAIKDALIDAPLITADAGYNSEANLKQVAGWEVAALIADNGMRQRDGRFSDQVRYKQNPQMWRSRTMFPLHDQSDHEKQAKKQATVYRPEDFHYDPATRTCICPAGRHYMATAVTASSMVSLPSNFKGR